MEREELTAIDPICSIFVQISQLKDYNQWDYGLEKE